jgi:hypothetical protein
MLLYSYSRHYHGNLPRKSTSTFRLSQLSPSASCNLRIRGLGPQSEQDMWPEPSMKIFIKLVKRVGDPHPSA